MCLAVLTLQYNMQPIGLIVSPITTDNTTGDVPSREHDKLSMNWNECCLCQLPKSEKFTDPSKHTIFFPQHLNDFAHSLQQFHAMGCMPNGLEN